MAEWFFRMSSTRYAEKTIQPFNHSTIQLSKA